MPVNTFHSADEILDFAIEREEESFAFYSDLASGNRNARLRGMFEEFAREELAHKEKLIALKKSHALSPGEKKITDLRIADYLVESKPGPGMGYQDALRLAMQREKAAFRLYTALAERAGDDRLRDAFLLLAQEEAKHKLRFEIEYDDLIMQEN